MRVLIIHPKLAFAVTLKQALERQPGWTARPFTSLDGAVEHLRTRPYDAALVDFALPGVDGAEGVRRLRAVQAAIPIIATSVDVDAPPPDVQGALSENFLPRDALALLGRLGGQPTAKPGSGGLRSRVTGNLPTPPPPAPAAPRPDTARLTEPPPPEDATPVPQPAAPRRLPSTTRQDQYVEFVLKEGMASVLDQLDQGNQPPPPPPGVNLPQRRANQTAIFDQLAADEPPAPLEGTIGDLAVGVQDSSFQRVLSILNGEDSSRVNPPLPPTTVMPPSFPDMPPRTGSTTKAPPLPGLPPSFPDMPPRETAPAYEFDFDDDDPESNTARIVLEAALDDSAPIDSFSLEALIASIERQLPAHGARVQPLPSWIAESQREAPAIPPPEMPEAPYTITTPTSELADRATVARIAPPAPEAETEALPLPLARPPEMPRVEEAFPFDFDEPIEGADVFASVEDWQDIGASIPDEDEGAPEDWRELDAIAEVEGEASYPVPSDGWQDIGTFTEPEDERASDGWQDIEPAAEASADVFYPAPPIDDPYLAQLALSLTEVSLELTAAAALLTRDNRMVAYAGKMERAEFEGVREALDGDWEANTDETRLGFVNVAGGRDYMRFTRRTVDDMSLTLIFAGQLPLSDVKRQVTRLNSALQAVPEPSAIVMEKPTEPERPDLTAAMLEAASADETRAPYAYVWTIRDPHTLLSPIVRRSIITGLKMQLHEQGWRVQEIEADDAYLYVYAEVPEESLPYESIRELKRRSAAIAAMQMTDADADALWGDGYLIVTPGRHLDGDEIQQFVNFQRMG